MPPASVAVIIPEAGSGHRDEEAVGDGRKDGHPVRPPEAADRLDPIAPDRDFFDGDTDLDDGHHFSALLFSIQE